MESPSGSWIREITIDLAGCDGCKSCRLSGRLRMVPGVRMRLPETGH